MMELSSSDAPPAASSMEIPKHRPGFIKRLAVVSLVGAFLVAWSIVLPILGLLYLWARV
jgi:hypothetical protein